MLVIHEEVVGPLIVRTSVEDDYQYMIDEDFDEYEETLEQIHNGSLLVFYVSVDVVLKSATGELVLGHDGLSGNIYEDYMDFITADDYYSDMKWNALNQARNEITRLAKLLSSIEV